MDIAWPFLAGPELLILKGRVLTFDGAESATDFALFVGGLIDGVLDLTQAFADNPHEQSPVRWLVLVETCGGAEDRGPDGVELLSACGDRGGGVVDFSAKTLVEAGQLAEHFCVISIDLGVGLRRGPLPAMVWSRSRYRVLHLQQSRAVVKLGAALGSALAVGLPGLLPCGRECIQQAHAQPLP